jgi:hypothetical protein
MNEKSEKVAKSAIHRLIEAKLVAPEKEKQLVELLAAGSLREDDWRIELERMLDPGTPK